MGKAARKKWEKRETWPEKRKAKFIPRNAKAKAIKLRWQLLEGVAK